MDNIWKELELWKHVQTLFWCHCFSFWIGSFVAQAGLKFKYVAKDQLELLPNLPALDLP